MAARTPFCHAWYTLVKEGGGWEAWAKMTIAGQNEEAARALHFVLYYLGDSIHLLKSEKSEKQACYDSKQAHRCAEWYA